MHAHLHGRVSRTGRFRIVLSRFVVIVGVVRGCVITVRVVLSVVAIVFTFGLALHLTLESLSTYLYDMSQKKSDAILTQGTV